MLPLRENVKAKKVLIVCTGNIFRSPIAAAFLRYALHRDNWHQISVSSAGLDAPTSKAIPPVIIKQMLLKYELNLSEHRSRPLTPELFQEADLVLVMEQQQVMRLAQQYPRQAAKLHLISELSGKVYDVLDMTGDSKTNVDQVSDHLYVLIEEGLTKVLHWLRLN